MVDPRTLTPKLPPLKLFIGNQFVDPGVLNVVPAEFVDHYVRTREWEVRQYERAVTNWELERYLELV